MNNAIPPQLLQALKKHKYHIVGSHSAVKRCKWFYEALTSDRVCYKQKFYGIKSHQCIQMSPAAFSCTQQCLFCWRAQNADLNAKWDETRLIHCDSPAKIVEGVLNEQDRILSGYKGHPKTDPQKLREAFTPKHVAISLTGEPTLYDPLGDLISTFHSKGLTTFLVSNGTMPEKLEKLGVEPSQLYISACAPIEKIYKQICRPQIANAWEKFNETLGLLPSFSCPTVIRMTLVKGHNMNDVEGYARLIERANPSCIEVKAYMHIGFSSLRLRFENMPSHEEVREFARRLSENTAYDWVDESFESRVVLLSKNREVKRFNS